MKNQHMHHLNKHAQLKCRIMQLEWCYSVVGMYVCGSAIQYTDLDMGLALEDLRLP